MGSGLASRRRVRRPRDATRAHARAAALAPAGRARDMGGGDRRWAEASPTRSGPEGSSRNEFCSGSLSSLHLTLSPRGRVSDDRPARSSPHAAERDDGPSTCSGRRSRATPSRPQPRAYTVIARKYRPQDLRGPDRPGGDGPHPDQRLRHRAASPTPSCSPACAGSARPPPRACWRGRSTTRARRCMRPAWLDLVERGPALPRHHRGPAHGRAGARRRQPHQGRRDARADSTACATPRPRRATRSTSSTKCTCSRRRPSTPCSRRWRSRRRTPSSSSPPPRSARCR